MKIEGRDRLEKLARKLAREYREDGLEIDDLQQEARLVILEQASNYREEMGISLSNFLRKRIRDRLRQFKNKSLDRTEIERFWEARSIAGGPEETIKADTKEQCEKLKELFGAEKFGKVHRVEQLANNTVSLDEEISKDSDGLSVTRYDEIAVSPNQLAHEATTWSSRIINKLSREDLEVLRLFCVEGLTGEEIGVRFGVVPSSVVHRLKRMRGKLSDVLQTKAA